MYPSHEVQSVGRGRDKAHTLLYYTLLGGTELYCAELNDIHNIAQVRLTALQSALPKTVLLCSAQRPIKLHCTAPQCTEQHCLTTRHLAQHFP